MPHYLSGPNLAEAVERLSTSRAKPSLCDFLILKRTMTQGDGTANLSLGDETYMGSIGCLVAVSIDGEDLSPPYFNPFGTKRERTRGWRSEKYPSNGPPVTVTGPGWKRVIEVISERPRRVRFTKDYLQHLAPVIARSRGSAPQLEDCALWLHRARPIATDESPVGAPLDRLSGLFVEEVGLSDDELQLIFGEE